VILEDFVSMYPGIAPQSLGTPILQRSHVDLCNMGVARHWLHAAFSMLVGSQKCRKIFGLTRVIGVPWHGPQAFGPLCPRKKIEFRDL